MNEARLPKPEIRGVGNVTYRCALCGEFIQGKPEFYPPLPLTANTRTYHKEHVPHGS